MISVTTPDPTVRPPSRIEKRVPSLNRDRSELLSSFQRYHPGIPFQYLLDTHQLRQ